MTKDDWFSKKETLHPELRPFVRPGPLGDMIHHKLVIELIFMPEHCAYINRFYEQKKHQLLEAFQNQDFIRWVFLHERPYRLQAFQDVAEQLSPTDYEALLAQIWIDTENAYEMVNDWECIWENIEKTIFDGIDAETRFQNLPERIRIRRGTSGDRDEWMSWTLDAKIAMKFANRFGKGKVVWGWIDKSDVKAFFTGRGEEEIVALMEDVEVE